MILTKRHNSFAAEALFSAFLFFNPLNMWFKRSGCVDGGTEAIVWAERVQTGCAGCSGVFVCP